jgi:SAM-dependent methyltransferase
MLTQQQVDRAYGLALVHCGSCRDYHLTRPFFVAAGIRGVERDRPLFVPLLQKFVRPGARLLVAAAGDSTLPELVLDAVGDRLAGLLVADRCETPLAQCRDLVHWAPITIETKAVDLVTTPPLGSFDIIVAHYVLPFIPPDSRVAFLRNLARMLAPGGLLIAAYPLARARGATRPGVTARLLEGLARHNISLPDPPAPLLEALQRLEAAGPKDFDGTAPEAIALFAAAGLDVVETSDSEVEPLRRYVVATPH